jgi:hypothetical protein
MLSINIHPTRGGVAPLYRPEKPSFLTVWERHWRGPENLAASEVCRRTLIVSKGWPTRSISLLKSHRSERFYFI